MAAVGLDIMNWVNIWDLGIRTLLDTSYKVWASLVGAWPFWAMMAMICHALSDLAEILNMAIWHHIDTMWQFW